MLLPFEQDFLRWEETDMSKKTSLSQLSLPLRLIVMSEIKKKWHKILHCMWWLLMLTLSQHRTSTECIKFFCCSVSKRKVRHFLLLCSYPTPHKTPETTKSSPSQHFLSHLHSLPASTDYVHILFYISLSSIACSIIDFHLISQRTF